MSSYLTPKEITQEMVEISKKKVSYNWLTIILLGILGGMFIALGSELSMMGTFDLPKFLGTGFSKIMAGSLFSVGLILVVMAGADLFTGNILIITGVLAKQVKVKQMIRNWLIIYFTNLIGALIIVAIMYYSN
ncbi:MAG: formate/nitrite transporter family protein, partial [bacterium]